MDPKNDPMGVDDTVFMLLETLKSNGTFDEFRRHCVSDIDAKPTFLNLKQRIESNVVKFLSKIKYTPELNKNIVRERLKKHLFDGREAHDIEEGTDRILNQVLAPRMVNVFEPKIEIAVNEYLGIKNEALLPEVNGLKESTMNPKNVSDFAKNVVFNTKIDLTSDTENMDNIDETSPEFEPISSVLDNDNSNDESISGMSDLISVGSPVQLVSKENHDVTSNGFENDKNIMEKLPHIDKNGINHKNTKSDDVKNSSNIEKLKTNDSKPKSKNSHSRTSSQEKSSIHKSKQRKSNSQEKNDIKKSNNNNSKEKKNSSHRHHSDSKDKKHRHEKKSNLSNRDKTTKRDRKSSRSDKKEKSSSLCKEPKSLNGNRSDDESNAGGSSKQKNNVHKNKSTTSDKSKSSSSHHKSSRKDNGSKDVDKSKDKSSISKTSNSSSHKNNKTHSKKRKHSLNNDSKLSESYSSVEEKKPKWCDFMTNDEQDAANVLLSISGISYDGSQSDTLTENILIIDNSLTDDTLKTSSNTTGNILKNQENSIKTKTVKFSDNDNIEENFNLQTSDIETPRLLQSIDNEKCDLPINQLSEKECIVDAESSTLLLDKDVAAQNTSFENCCINSEPNKEIELEVPKLKLKLLPNQIDSLNYEKRRKHHKSNKSKVKKFKKSCDPSYEVVPLIDSVSTALNCEQNNQEILTLKESKIKNSQPLENNESLDTFKGFSQSDAVPCKNYENLKLLVKTLKKSIKNENIQSIINNDDGFKGFTCEELHPCENRDLVNLQLTKLKEEIGFKGFSEEEILMSSGHKYIKQKLELKKKQNDTNNDQSSITCGENGIKNGKTFKEVMSIIYESNNDSKSTTKQVVTTDKKECSVVNNNNHGITASNDWVVKQEMKYKLLPVKVKLERLMEYRYTDTKRIPDSPQVSLVTVEK